MERVRIPVVGGGLASHQRRVEESAEADIGGSFSELSTLLQSESPSFSGDGVDLQGGC